MARTPEKIYLPLRQNPTGASLIVLTTAMLAFGVVMVKSSLSSLRLPAEWYNQTSNRHILYAVISALVLCIGWRVNYRFFQGKSKLPLSLPLPALIVLAATIVGGLLVFAPVIGHRVGGFARWIRLGPVQFQPSELIKLSLLIFLAAWLSNERVKVRSIGTFLVAGLFILASVGVIATQDFGTAAIIGVSAAVTLLLAGVPWYYLMSLVVPAAGAFYFLVYHNAYRWTRMMTMMDPWKSYQSSMALLAINSGGWTGLGLGNGIIKMGFLPERSTDYIFSVICEELGMVGACLLLALLIVWIWQVRRAALNAADRFGQLLAGALGFVIVLQAILHIAVNLAVAPPKGIGLPFLSAGGTSMVIMAAAVALIVSVTARRKLTNDELTIDN
jgi:cell division protein FtsW